MVKIDEKTIKELGENKDEIRGVDFKTDEGFILGKWGKEGIERVEKEMKKMGSPLSYKEISIFKFYPMGFRTLSLLAIKDVFEMSDKEIEDMGKEAPKHSLFIKILIRYFFSFEKFVKKVPGGWRKHHTTGKLEIRDYSLEKKYIILRLKDHQAHPLYCSRYLLGYWVGIAEIVLKEKNVFANHLLSGLQPCP